jgi:hypothetical protein
MPEIHEHHEKAAHHHDQAAKHHRDELPVLASS